MMYRLDTFVKRFLKSASSQDIFCSGDDLILGLIIQSHHPIIITGAVSL